MTAAPAGGAIRRWVVLGSALSLACGAEVRPGSSTRSAIREGAGLSRESIDAVVGEHLPAIKACYERFAKAEGRPMGVVRIGWHVETTGSVTAIEIVATTLHSTSIEGCITEEVGRWRFPAASRSTEVNDHPFTF